MNYEWENWEKSDDWMIGDGEMQCGKETARAFCSDGLWEIRNGDVMMSVTE